MNERERKKKRKKEKPNTAEPNIQDVGPLVLCFSDRFYSFFFYSLYFFLSLSFIQGVGPLV